MSRRALACVFSGLVCVVIAGCSGLLEPAPPVSGPPTTPEPTLTPTGKAVRIESATLSDDSRAVTLNFVGGREYVASDPCTRAYAGLADEEDGVLQAVVMDVTPNRPLPPNFGCTLVGYPRSVAITLPAPFLGSRLNDRAGYVLFLRRPPGLIEIKGIPAGWLLRSEKTLEESPTGRWERIYSPDASPGGDLEIRELDVFQGFDGPASVSGGDDQLVPVQIGKTTGMFFGPDAQGEMVLAWQFDTDGLAIAGNTADFSRDAFIALAESASRE